MCIRLPDYPSRAQCRFAARVARIERYDFLMRRPDDSVSLPFGTDDSGRNFLICEMSKSVQNSSVRSLLPSVLCGGKRMNQEEIASREAASQLDDRFEPTALALKARKGQNTNGLILQRFPRLSLKIMGLLGFY